VNSCKDNLKGRVPNLCIWKTILGDNVWFVFVSFPPSLSILPVFHFIDFACFVLLGILCRLICITYILLWFELGSLRRNVCFGYISRIYYREDTELSHNLHKSTIYSKEDNKPAPTININIPCPFSRFPLDLFFFGLR